MPTDSELYQADLVARVVQARPYIFREIIERNIGKLQRLAATLHKINKEREEEDTSHFERKAKALAQELGADCLSTGKARGAALRLYLDGRYFDIF